MKFWYIYGRKFTKYLHGTWSLLNILMIFGIKKIDNFDPHNVLLAIATNIPVLLMTAFVLQGHNWVYCVYLLCIYKHTHACSIYFETIYMYIFYAYNINIYIICKPNRLTKIYTCMCVYLYKHNTYRQYTHIYIT